MEYEKRQRIVSAEGSKPCVHATEIESVKSANWEAKHRQFIPKSPIWPKHIVWLLPLTLLWDTTAFRNFEPAFWPKLLSEQSIKQSLVTSRKKHESAVNARYRLCSRRRRIPMRTCGRPNFAGKGPANCNRSRENTCGSTPT